MERKITPEEILIVPRHYFEGAQRELQKIVDRLEIHDMDTMQLLLRFRDWLKPTTVEEKFKEMYPTIQWENIPLLLRQEEPYQCPFGSISRKDHELKKQ